MPNDSSPLIVGVSSQEYMDAALNRFEDMYREDLRIVRSDIETLKQNHVQRAELTNLFQSMRTDMDRIERQTDHRFSEFKTDFGKRLDEFKAEVVRSNERSLVIVGIVLAIVTSIVQLVIQLI